MKNAMHHAHRAENGRPGGNFEPRFYQPSPAQLAKAHAAAADIELTPAAEVALVLIDAAIAASDAKWATRTTA